MSALVIVGPLRAVIPDLLALEGLAPETRLLIELALEAQKTGSMPDLSLIMEEPDVMPMAEVAKAERGAE